MQRRLFLILGLGLGLVACGGSSGGGPGGGSGSADAPVAAQTIKVSGIAKEVTAGGATPVAGVLVAAYKNSDENTAVAMATTDAAGAYSLTITTNGAPLDGYLKATLNTYMDTYLYPPAPLAADFSMGAINMLKPSTFSLLSDTLCRATQDSAKGAVALIVFDASNVGVAGATITTAPASNKYCYNGSNGLPSSSATMTSTDGVAYAFNITDTVMVSATATGKTFKSHSVKARAGALTTTVIQP